MITIRNFCIAIALIAGIAPAMTARAHTTGGSQKEAATSMPERKTMIDLFDRWEKVWHEGAFDLVPSCVGDHYIRHDENGDRTVTRDAYAVEIAKA